MKRPESYLFNIELHDGLLEIADTAVNKLSRSAASAGGEVVLLDHSSLQTTALGVNSNTSSSGTATNHENIVLIILFGKHLDLLFASWQSGQPFCRLGRCLQNRFPVLLINRSA